VADTRQHQCALFHLPFDPAAHVKKCGPRRAHLQRAARPVGHRPPLAESLGSIGKPLDRAQLVAQEGIGNHRHQHRCQNHPDQKLMRV